VSDIQDFMVSLREVPPTGLSSLLVRTDETDHALITAAAAISGMSQQKFMRTVLVSAAKQVMKEAGRN